MMWAMAAAMVAAFAAGASLSAVRLARRQERTMEIFDCAVRALLIRVENLERRGA